MAVIVFYTVISCDGCVRSLEGLGTYDAKKARDLGTPTILCDKPAEKAIKREG